jgi:hypothetical protein
VLRQPLLLALAAFVPCSAARPARAADPAPVTNPVAREKADQTDDFVTRRFEPAAFPIIGGNSDIGVEFGAAATLSRFGDGAVPYRWNMDLVATASLASVPGGVEVAQQAYLWDIDIPELAGGRLRLNPYAEFRRTVNQGYFGLGNASSAARPAGANNRYFEYIHEEAGARLPMRYELSGDLYLLSSTAARYVNPAPYPGSKLAQDAAAAGPNGGKLLIGVKPLAIVSEAAGVTYDSRDSEGFTRDGWLGVLGTRFSQAFPVDAGIAFGETEVTLAKYTRLGGPFVLAIQGAADFKYGHIPFFELFTGGVFKPDDMIGGSASIRGVPFGRYLGPIKAVANFEVRGLFFRTRLLGQSFQLGGDVFFDTGRVWSDYTFRSRLDGNGPELKWGSGVGGYLLWGQAAMFRLDVAYSPDIVAVNPGFPLGIYVEDGLSF